MRFFPLRAKEILEVVYFLTILCLVVSPASAQPSEAVSKQTVINLGVGETAWSLREAMDRGAERSARSVLASEKIEEWRGRALEASSGLLPRVSGQVSQARETLNLASLGFSTDVFPLPSTRLGPFNVFDARVSLLQNIFDWQAIEHHRVGRAELRKAESEAALAREQARLQAGLAYLALLQADSLERGSKADVELADDVARIVKNQNQAGLSTGIDRTRAETQLSLAQSQLVQAQMRKHEAELRLKRALDLPLGTPLNLSDALQEPLSSPFDLEGAIQRAQDRRLELKVAREELRVQGLRKKTAEAGWIPDLGFGANYGASGNTPSENLEDTYQIGVKLGVPIFDGGLTLAKTAQARSRERQARVLLHEAETQVEQDVRLAHQSVLQMESKVKSAKQAFALAQRQMQQAQNQLKAGVIDSLGLVTAEASLSRAREEYYSSLAQYQASRMGLSYAQGDIEAFP